MRLVKEYKKECIYICITESLCCTAEINTTLNQLYLNKIKKDDTGLVLSLSTPLLKGYSNCHRPPFQFLEKGTKKPPTYMLIPMKKKDGELTMNYTTPLPTPALCGWYVVGTEYLK